MLSYEVTSRTGAAASRRVSRKNPMQVLVDLIDGDPTASSDRLFKKWWGLVQADEEYLEAVGRHAFTNMLSSLERDRRASKPRSVQAARQVAKERKAASMVASAVAIKLMEMVMPNGKRLKDCTFAEVGKFGSWFKALSTKGKPSEIVGKKLTEADLQKIGRA